MKRMMLFAAVTGLALCAQADSGWGVMGTYWDAGDWGGAGGVGTKLSVEAMPGALLDFRAAWIDDLSPDLEGADADVEVTPLEFGVSLVKPLGGVDVFGGGGIGYYLLDGDVTAGGVQRGADLDDETGWYLNAGVELPLVETGAWFGATRTTVYAEVLYRSVSVDDIPADGATYDVGDDLQGFAVNVGFMLRW